MKEKLMRIINHYGLNHQIKKLNEETFELTEAIIKFEYGLEKDNSIDEDLANKQHITEEMSDCYVMLEQFKLYYEITDEEVEKIMEEKVDRQLSSIREEPKEVKLPEKLLMHYNDNVEEEIMLNRARINMILDYLKAKEDKEKEK